MFCNNCGKEIPDGSNFCKFCGNSLSKNEKKVKVIFHRVKKYTGCLLPMNIYVDRKVVGTIKNDEKLEIDIPCGKHSIIVEMSGSTADEKTITFSEEYSKTYIDLELKMGFWTNKIQFVSIINEK